MVASSSNPDSSPSSPPLHSFYAISFVENLSLKELAAAFTSSRRTAHELEVPLAGGGEMFIYPFGAVVFHNVSLQDREQELARLHQARPGLTSAPLANEEFTVRESAEGKPSVSDGVLTIDHLTPARAGIVALTVAQSSAMEYYETIIEDMFGRTDSLVDRLERRGTVSMFTRQLHRFIGTAVGVRNEVLAVLHLLDKPDATWDDPCMDHIYNELRAEFDLVDRYEALAAKLRSVQEGLELVLDVARDRRLVLLDEAIVLLIVVEIVLTLMHW